MAYIPTNAGWGAAATRKKKTPPPTAAAPKPTKSYDPYGALAGASPQQLAQILFRTQMAGPDYSSVTPPDFNQLQTAALSQAQQSAYRQATPIQDERGYQQARQKVSAEAATNFAKAFSDILTGGKPGAEGEAFSLQNFGGSYLAGMAAQMGQQLISQQQHSFDEQDFRLASKLADIMDAVPEQADKIYQGLADQAVELFKQNKSIADADFKTQIEAIASLIKNKRDDAKGVGGNGKPVVRNFSDGTSRQYNPQTGKWDVITSEAAAPSKPRIFQTSEGVFAINEETGQVVWEKKNGKAKTTKVTTQVVEQPDGSKNLIDKSTGKVLSVVAPPDPNAGGSSGSKSTSSVSTTVARAQKAAEDVLGAWTDAIRQKYALPQDASDAAKAANTKKYQAEVARNFGRAMYKVITAIAPHLKALGYTHARIKWEAYQMVRAAGITPLSSYKAPKPPKADAARVAASNPLPPPQAIDFNWLAAATTGSTNHSDLGGPSAHYAKHDSGENWQSNNAWDIGMPVGTPIYAATDGVIGSDVGVQASRPDDGQRLTLNGQGNSFWYGHLSKIAVRPGQRVRAGQLIGYSGASANGAAHLHIGVMNIGENHA